MGTDWELSIHAVKPFLCSGSTQAYSSPNFGPDELGQKGLGQAKIQASGRALRLGPRPVQSLVRWSSNIKLFVNI